MTTSNQCEICGEKIVRGLEYLEGTIAGGSNTITCSRTCQKTAQQDRALRQAQVAVLNGRHDVAEIFLELAQ